MPNIPIFQADNSVETRPMRQGVEKPLIDAGLIMRAGSAVQGYLNRRAAQQQAEQDQLASNEAKLQVINAGTDLELKARQQLEQDVTNGTMAGSTDRLMTNFDQWASDAVTNASPRAQPVMQQHLAEMRGRVNQMAYGAEMQARTEAVAGDFLNGVSADRKLVYADPTQFSERLAQRNGLADALAVPSKQRDALRTAAQQGLAFDAAAGIIDRNPVAFLDQAGMGRNAAPEDAQKALASNPILANLKPEDYRNLIDHALARRDQLDAASKRQGDQVLADAQKAVGEMSDFVDSGATPSLSYVQQAQSRVLGTPYEDAVTQLVDAARRGAGFGAQTLPRQRAVLQGYDAQLSQGSSPEDAAHLQRLRTINATQEKAYADNPWDAATRFQHLPPAPAMDITAPEGGVALIQQRKPLMAGVETAAGAPVSPLQPSEAAQWGSQLKSLSVSARAEVLAAAGQGLSGGQVNALADQLGKSDPAIGLMLKLNDRTTAGRTVAELVGQGAQALSDKTVKRDDSALAGWKADIASKVRGSLGNTQAENDVIEAAYYVRAAGELGSAGAAPGYSGVKPDTDSALAMVIGSPLERAGVKTFLPRGMDQSTFDTRLRAAASPQALAPQATDGKVYAGGREVPLPIFSGHILDRGLRLYSPGVYASVVGNTIVTLDKEGKRPLLLKVQ